MALSSRSLAGAGAALLLVFSSCSKDPEAPALSVTTAEAPGAPTVVPLTFTPAPPTKPASADYAFDWDAATVMPTPPGSAPIPAPWAPTAVRAFSDDLRDDHRKADGWELLYNNFSSVYAANTPTFILYNKYRGLVRCYYYQQTDAQSARSYQALASTPKLGGSAATSSPLLSFAAQSVVDPLQNAQFASSLEMQPIGERVWYAVQSELAYDRNIGRATHESLSLTWQLNGSKVDGIRLGTSQVGTRLPVSFQVEGVDLTRPTLFSTALSYDGPVWLRLTGPASLASLQQAGVSTAEAQQALSLQPGVRVFSGVVPSQNAGTGALVQVPAQMKFNSDANVLLTNFNVALPGYANGTTVGWAPQYNEAPGVFFLESRPTVLTRQQVGGTQPYTYTLDVPSVRYLFNPAVTRIADIKNIRQEIVAVGDTTVPEPPLYIGSALAANRPLHVRGVRVSFDVVPKNGSTTIRHTKTFRANSKPQ
ncbi:hypothetical protein K3G63_01980 [Hymenobacter sp. HSC-4F20]|uniref:hypothetical protein n=1 Tax=Hymenobacter sp. HSC-4F20 TaxID=2864135 RepID=UPI001C73AC7B|nr:hypothetical protein [Hymenobacter sp. HSC-4F20]MBX0289186.1 hypothetical protein [Hymenobacter sp. HSC-4F20]